MTAGVVWSSGGICGALEGKLREAVSEDGKVRARSSKEGCDAEK